MKFALLFLFLSQLLMAQVGKIIDKKVYYSKLKDSFGLSQKNEFCEQTTTIQPPFFTTNKYLPGGKYKDTKWGKAYENLRSDSNAKSDIKSILPVGSIVNVDQKITNQLYFDLENLNKSKIKLAKKILNDYFPRNSKIENVFLRNIGTQDNSRITEIAKTLFMNESDTGKLNKVFYNYHAILKELEASKYPSLKQFRYKYVIQAQEINKAIINISKYGLVPIEILYTDKSLVEQFRKRQIREKGKINMTSFTNDIAPSQKNNNGFINANALDLHPENKYVFKVRKDSPLFITGTGKNKLAENLSNKILKYRISFDPTLKANTYHVEKCCFNDLNKGTLLCTFKSYLYDIEDLQGRKEDSKWIDLTPPCCMESNLNILQPLPTDHYKTFLSLMNAFKSDRRYHLSDKTDAEQKLLLAQNIASKSYVTISNKSGKLVYQPNSHLNDDLMKIPLYERDTQIYTGLDHNKKPIQATAIIRRGPFNTYHYPTHLGEDESNDEWGKPESVCAFMQIAKHWRDNMCPRDDDTCNIGFGHVYHPQSLGKHSAHQSGECFDIRPFSKNDSKRFQKVNMNDKNSGYDRDMTNNLIQLLAKGGGTGILFNDLTIKNKQKSKSIAKGHYNHIHVCFKTKNDLVKKTCKEGL